MRFDVLTLFPEMFSSPLQCSIIKRAIESGLIEVKLHNFREFATDKHRSVDDYPYGGGSGMVLRPGPIFSAVEEIKKKSHQKEGIQDIPVVLLTPQGRLLSQQIAVEFAARERVILICGHYEGVDERVRQHLVTDEISIGDYVMTGGEMAAMVFIDVVSRLISGVLGDESSITEESHTSHLLEYPQYTRPAEYQGLEVPSILLLGNHAKISRWRHKQSLWRTWKRRPELLQKTTLSASDREQIRFWECGGEFSD